jgi:hypothetical protein
MIDNATNFSLDKNSTTGGAVRMTSAGGVSQGNGGTSLPCRFCFVSAPATNTAPTKFNIDAAASAILGAELVEGCTIKIPIDDVSKLYFFTTGATDIVDVTWMV